MKQGAPSECEPWLATVTKGRVRDLGCTTNNREWKCQMDFTANQKEAIQVIGQNLQIVACAWSIRAATHFQHENEAQA